MLCYFSNRITKYFYLNQVTLEQRTYQNREVLETYLQGYRTDIIANLYIFFFGILYNCIHHNFSKILHLVFV